VVGGVGRGQGPGGFLLAAATDLPSGAVIVLLSTLLVAVAALAARWWRGRAAVRESSGT
jgi:ABC-type Mn2+/Zn2+ transport system permease subunit